MQRGLGVRDFLKKRAGLTFAWRAICLTNRGRFRSETIFVTVVSTKPSRSEKEEKGKKKETSRNISHNQEVKIAAYLCGTGESQDYIHSRAV